jgi:hypothetical protein
MLRPDASLVYQLRARDVSIIEEAIDGLRNSYGPKNIAVSRINQSHNNPEILICYVTVFKPVPRDSQRLSSWMPERQLRELEER